MQRVKHQIPKSRGSIDRKIPGCSVCLRWMQTTRKITEMRRQAIISGTDISCSLIFIFYLIFNISIFLYLNIPMMHWLQKVWLRFIFEGGLKVKKLSNTSVGNLFTLWDRLSTDLGQIQDHPQRLSEQPTQQDRTYLHRWAGSLGTGAVS